MQMLEAVLLVTFFFMNNKKENKAVNLEKYRLKLHIKSVYIKIKQFHAEIKVLLGEIYLENLRVHG